MFSEIFVAFCRCDCTLSGIIFFLKCVIDKFINELFSVGKMLSKSAGILFPKLLLFLFIKSSSADYCDPENLDHPILCDESTNENCVHPRKVFCNKQCFNQDFPIFLDTKYYSHSELRSRFNNVNSTNGVCITGKK